MRVFLTGSTGYVGSRLATRLAAAGHEVAALARDTSDGAKRRRLEAAGVRLFYGDVTDRYSLREGMSGADWVVHAAADLDFAAPPARQRAVNIEGSANVASLAFKLGVGRLLTVSTIAVFGGSPDDGAPATEGSAPREPLPSLYGFTKSQADAVVAEWAERGLPVNTVYPSMVYGTWSGGEGDDDDACRGRRGGANPLIAALARGRLPALVGGRRRMSWVHLDDLVDGVLRVLEHAPPGERYLLTGEVATLERLVAEVERLSATAAPRLRLSPTVARGVGILTAPLYKLRRRRSPFLRDYLRSLAREWAFDDAKARRELGWQRRDLAAGLPPTVEGLLRRRPPAG